MSFFWDPMSFEKICFIQGCYNSDFHLDQDEIVVCNFPQILIVAGATRGELRELLPIDAATIWDERDISSFTFSIPESDRSKLYFPKNKDMIPEKDGIFVSGDDTGIKIKFSLPKNGEDLLDFAQKVIRHSISVRTHYVLHSGGDVVPVATLDG